MQSQNYKPLPPEVTVGQSPIEGLGIIAETDIPKGFILGITHVYDDSGNFRDNLIRTPLGGFLNHSEEPNAEIKDYGDYRMLFVIVDINEGQEVTVDYRTSECGKTYSFIK